MVVVVGGAGRLEAVRRGGMCARAWSHPSIPLEICTAMAAAVEGTRLGPAVVPDLPQAYPTHPDPPFLSLGYCEIEQHRDTPNAAAAACVDQ